MGLFSKKPPCPICGGKISWLLPAKIEGEYVCDVCHNKIDMDSAKQSNLTMQDFRAYLAFYDQNQLLKNKFVVSDRIDFGILDTKMIFDYQNKLFCMSKNPDKTVFEGRQIKSFVINEDNTPLYQGSAQGIVRYASTVPERAMALAPQITQFMINQRLAKTMDQLNGDRDNSRTTSTQYFDIPEPFRSFNVELHFDHPYWTIKTCDMSGPRFSNDHPDVNDYMRSYQRSIAEIEKLVFALKTVAFPDAPEKSVGFSAAGSQPISSAPADAVEEIKKYKALMEDGIISAQEFEAKKKQLLGI